MKSRIICVVILVLFTVLGVGPIPLTSTFGLAMVIFRPIWFKRLIDRIYSDSV